MKTKKIQRIKSLLLEKDFPPAGEIFTERSPIYGSIGERVFALIEDISLDRAGVIVYLNDQIIDQFNVAYEEIDEDILDDIIYLLEKVEV